MKNTHFLPTLLHRPAWGAYTLRPGIKFEQGVLMAMKGLLVCDSQFRFPQAHTQADDLDLCHSCIRSSSRLLSTPHQERASATSPLKYAWMLHPPYSDSLITLFPSHLVLVYSILWKDRL